MNTPRALWVPFALGRPLGSADDPQFQRSVLNAAFDLLSAPSPVIADYPVDIPVEAGLEQWACPVSYQVPDDDSPTGRLLAEIAQLSPWANETRTNRGRTLFGVSGAQPDQIDEVAKCLGHMAETGEVLQLPPTTIDWQFPMPLLIRHLADDLRTFYHEAVASQPGAAAPNHDALSQWIFGSTALGNVLRQIDAHLGEVDNDPKAALVRGLLLPHGSRH